MTSQEASFPPSVVFTFIVADPTFKAVTFPVSSTVAMLSSELLHATLLSVASSGVTVAVNCADSPIIISTSFLSRLTSSTGILLAETVIEHDVSLFPSVVVTVIFTVPGATAVTFPALSTVATFSSELVHFTDLSEASSGLTVAFNWADSPSVSSISVLSRVTPVTLIVLEVTVTEQVAVLEPSVVVTVMVAEPALTAVTFPLLSTVATPVSEDFQLTALFVALVGATVAVSVSDPPSAKVRLVLLSDTPVTATVWLPPPPFP